MRVNKRISLVLIGICLTFGLTACHYEGKWLFSLCGEKLYEEDVKIFGLIYMMEHNVTSKEHFNEIRQDHQTFGDYYKGEIETDLVETVLIYNAAKDEKFQLEKESKEEVDKKVEDFIEFYGEDWMKGRDIKKSDLQKVYEMKVLSQWYLDHFYGETGEKKEEENQYVKVYQVSFLTVVLDDTGKMKSNEDGTIEKISLDESLRKKEEAEEFAKKAKDGKDIETLLKEYQTSATGVEKYLKYDDLSEEYKNEMDALDEGEISGVISSDYGYYVMKILSKNADDYEKIIYDHQSNKKKEDEKEKKLNALYKELERNDNKYKNENRWKDITISSFFDKK